MTSSLPTRIVLIDDHRHIHETVTIALSIVDDLQLVGHGASGEEAILLCQTLQPHIILMDVVMPGMNGIEATRNIRDAFPDIMILALSSYDDDESVQDMLREGASGYIPKDSIARSLVSTIRASRAGHTILPASMRDTLTQALPAIAVHPTQFNLTQRELEVLRLIASGLNNAQIAQQLFISQSTVKYHLSNIQRKMNVNTRAEVIVLGVKNGLI